MLEMAAANHLIQSIPRLNDLEPINYLKPSLWMFVINDN